MSGATGGREQSVGLHRLRPPHPLALDPEPAEYSLAAARVALPDGPREGRPFAAAVPAPEGADAYGRLAAWLGRRPLAPTR